MAEKFLNKIAFTDKDNIKWWGYTFPGFQVTEPTQKTSVLGSSKLAARGDHSHRTGQLIETTDFLFMKNAERTKLGTYPTTYAQVQQYVVDQILGGTYVGTVEFYGDLPTSGMKDGDIYGVLKDTPNGKPSGDYRYHDQTTHPTQPPIATGWYLVSSNRVPLASADYNGLLSSVDFSWIQEVKNGFKGLIPQGSTIVTDLGGITGTSVYAARADHLHDTRYLMLGGTAQTVSKDVTFSKFLTIGAWGTSDIRDTSGNSLLGVDATYTYLAKQAGITLIRSGATDLIHRKNDTDYKILDASNILGLTIQLNDTAQPVYNGLTARTINITPGGIGTYTKVEIDKKVGDINTDIGSNYLPLSAGINKALTGKLIAAKGIGLNNAGVAGISFYTKEYVTWVEYMTYAGAGMASTGGVAPTYGDVTSWARRSTIEQTSGYGWIWDSCANGTGNNPDPKMALSSNTGNLKVKGDVTAPSFIGALVGNASTATKLATARNIGVGNTQKKFDGSADVLFSLSEIGALPLTGGTVTGLTKFNNGVQIGSVNGIGWYLNNSVTSRQNVIAAGDSTAQNVNVGSLLVSNYWIDGSLVPTNGIYSKGVIHSAAGYYVQGNRIANLNLTRNASMISRWDSFTTDATNLPGVDTNSSGSVNDGLVNTLFWDSNFGMQIAYDIDGSGIAYRGYIPSTGVNKTGWKFLADTAWVKSQISAGVVTSANKLTTPRAINGTNFDGTAAITTARWGTDRTITIGSTGKTVNGSTNVAWTLTEIGAAAASHTHTKSQITDFPTTWAWGSISDKPSTFTPSAHNHSLLKGWADTRSTAETPNSYNNVFEVKGIKKSSTYGINSGDYVQVFGFRGWSDSSGGHSHEFALADNGKIYHRNGATTSWSAWNQIAYTSDIPTWSTLSGKPETATRWPAWDEVTGKPSTFTPSTHTHTKSQITDFPTTWDWSNVANKLIEGSNSTGPKDCNSSLTNGIYYYNSNGPATSIGASTKDGALFHQKYSDNWISQIAQDYRNGNLFVRGKNNGTWQAWKKIATVDLIPTTIAWGNVTGKPSTFTPAAHTHESIVGRYTGSGGVQGPNYMGVSAVRFNMMYANPPGNSSDGDTSYCDWILMNCYSWEDVPYATAIGISKKTSNPRAWIMCGPNSSDRSTWSRKELACKTDIPASLKCPYSLTIQQNGTTLDTYDGSAAKTVNITATSVSLTKSSVMAALNTAGTNTFTQYCDFTAGAGNSGSDMRFKKNIKPIGNILDDLMNVEIFTYIWNKKDERNFDTLGVSADQLKENKLFEKLVHERPDETKTQFVDYDRIGVLALKGLQELNNKVTEENKKLKERVEKLEKILKLVGDKIGVEIDL